MSSTLLTKEEVADRLHICERTVDRLRSRGLLPSILFMSRVRFRPEDVDALLHAHRRSSTRRTTEGPVQSSNEEVLPCHP
jgi:excisionase family DNA binding protein